MSKISKMDTPVKWGIIGCGDVTEVKSGPPYQLTEGFELKAVMRRNAEKAKDYAQRHSVEKYYIESDALINDPEIDAVYVATPPDTHMYYGLKVAEAGKPCCIEKPMAPNYEESLAIYNAFKEKDLPLFIAYYRRNLPRFLQVQNWLDEGVIGEVRHICWHLSKPPSEIDLSGTYNWRTNDLVAPGGYFDDLASHGIDLFAFLLGDIKEVSGVSLNQQNLYKAKDAITACWLHEMGVTGVGNWNFGSYHSEESVTIYGSKGKIQFSVFEEVPLILDSESKQTELVIEHPKHIQTHHLKDMKKHLIDGIPHPSNGLSGSQTSWVMDKILGVIK